MLPERAGIPPSRVYLPEGPWETLLEFLRQRFPRLPAGILEQRLRNGDIVDERGIAQGVDAPYRAGQWLWYYREVPDETPVPFELTLLHRDDRLVVVDKPHFMASTPGGRYLRHTALVRARAEFGLPSLSPMHRLDRDTAGVLMFCVEPSVRGRYQALFQSRSVSKEYEAVARVPPGVDLPHVHRSRLEEVPGRFVMREVPGEPNSETRIELLRWLDPAIRLAHLRLLPVTGRKHQLRAHLSVLGMPILNDPWYSTDRPADTPPFPLRRAAPAAPNFDAADDSFDSPLQLLARAVEFRDPLDGSLRRYESRRTLQVVAEYGPA